MGIEIERVGQLVLKKGDTVFYEMGEKTVTNSIKVAGISDISNDMVMDKERHYHVPLVNTTNFPIKMVMRGDECFLPLLENDRIHCTFWSVPSTYTFGSGDLVMILDENWETDHSGTCLLYVLESGPDYVNGMIVSSDVPAYFVEIYEPEWEKVFVKTIINNE